MTSTRAAALRLLGVAGALFGLAGGIAISFVASMLSAVVGFAIGRRLGRDAVAELSGPRLARVEDVLRRQGVTAVVVARPDAGQRRSR